MKINIAVEPSVATAATAEAGGRSQKWFDGLTKREQKQYIADNPRSKFNPARKAKAAKSSKAAVKKPASKAAPAKKKTALTEKHAQKSQQAQKSLDKRYDALHDKLKKLEDKQKYKPTKERKVLIGEVKKRLKAVNVAYSKHQKIISKVLATKRAADMKADPKRVALVDRMELAQRQAKMSARDTESPSGWRRAERASERAKKIKAMIDRHDARMAKKKAG